jgi:hypothetical protein
MEDCENNAIRDTAFGVMRDASEQMEFRRMRENSRGQFPKMPFCGKRDN